MSYTKGPWHACCSGDGMYSHYVFGPGGDEAICAMLSNDPQDKAHSYEPLAGIVTLQERQSNARLIAAAPELLEALKAFKRDWHELSGRMRGTTLDAIDKAIAKAEGRTE